MRWFPILLILGACDLGTLSSSKSTDVDEDTGDTGSDTDEDINCVAEDRFGAVVCNIYYTNTQVQGAFTIGWLDPDGEIDELDFEVHAREDGDDWSQQPISVTQHSTTEAGNKVIGLTIPGTPQDDAEVRIYGKVWLTDGTSFDICDFESGVIVHIGGVEMNESTCGTYYRVDW